MAKHKSGELRCPATALIGIKLRSQVNVYRATGPLVGYYDDFGYKSHKMEAASRHDWDDKHTFKVCSSNDHR